MIGDHGLLAQSINDKHNNGIINVTKKETKQATIGHIISFLERCNSVQRDVLRNNSVHKCNAM